MGARGVLLCISGLRPPKYTISVQYMLVKDHPDERPPCLSIMFFHRDLGLAIYIHKQVKC